MNYLANIQQFKPSVANAANEWEHYLRHDYIPDCLHFKESEMPKDLKEEHKSSRRKITAFVRRHTNGASA